MPRKASESQLPTLLKASEVAEWLGISEQALAQDRYRGEGVPFVRIGQTRIRYRLDDLLEYVNENTNVPSDPPTPQPSSIDPISGKARGRSHTARRV